MFRLQEGRTSKMYRLSEDLYKEEMNRDTNGDKLKINFMIIPYKFCKN